MPQLSGSQSASCQFLRPVWPGAQKIVTRSHATVVTSPEENRIPAALRTAIRRKLLRWYDRNKRDLPWRRRSQDPYAQWVAEIMLQQTRVDTVIPYYEKFLARFPNALSLARGSQETVLKHWEGLGYYRRAILLHKACQQLRAEKNAVPCKAAELKTLPGIGDYTSAAIASISGNESIAAVDGNVARVVARLFCVELDVLSSGGKSHITKLADQLIHKARPGDFNQAWMDLGSQVCTPRTPSCETCPLGRECLARVRGCTGTLPIRGATKSRKVPVIHCVVVVLSQDRNFLVRRRPIGGLWGGLWEFPNIDMLNGQQKTEAVTELVEAMFVESNDLMSLTTIRHQLTHRLMAFHVFTGQAIKTERQSAGNAYRWVTKAQFAKLSVSTAHRKIYKAASLAN